MHLNDLGEVIEVIVYRLGVDDDIIYVTEGIPGGKSAQG